jgi:hypothetical protein
LPLEPDLPANPPPAEYWTAQERWIWDQTLRGELADFNARYHEPLDPKQDDARWSDDKKPRLVRDEFLLDVLGRKRYLEAIPPRGLNIIGARFGSNLRLMVLVVDRGVGLMRSRFEGAVDLAGARLDRSWSFAGSAFNQVLEMNGLTVGENLFLSGARFASNVVLVWAKIDKQLRANGATFEAGLNMNSLTVGQNLFLDGARFAGDVVLVGAKVHGHIDTSGAIFEAGLDLDSLTVGQNLFLGLGARFAGDVDLVGAKVHGHINTSGATFKAGLNMDGLTVGQNLVLGAGARFAGDVVLVGATVHGDIDTRGATFEAGLNMDSLTVGQNLFLGGATFRALVDASGLTTTGQLRLHPPPTWGDGARFVLRNAHIGALDDGGAATENPWPERCKLELDGFSYGWLMLPRTVHWYIDQWLARDTSYTPQPYQHLAGVLRALGDPSGANDVLYAARERERSEAWKARAWHRWLGLLLLRGTIGYGLGWRYFLVLIWIGLFTLGGAVMLWTSGADKVRPAAGIARSVGPAAPSKLDEVGPAAQEHVPSDPKTVAAQAEPEDRQGFVWCLWASFDWMLPFIELDEASIEAVARLQGGPGYLLYFQALAGYVLAGFLAAGLAGLTQSRG